MAEITRKEFLELLQEFSDKTLDPKFKKIDSRFTESREDIVHQFHLISEDLTSKIQQVAEGVIQLNEKMDRRFDEVNKKIEETRQDVLAGIKFSYSELDKRITTLETEVKDLKHRMDNLEQRSVS